MKTEFLAVYDYGMGGVWAVISARSAEEVTRKYPDLQVVEGRPGWMTDKDYDGIMRTSRFDIDDAPSGWLAAL